jgi:hypothetical protein
MRTRSQTAVHIDFDAASVAWRKNKIPLENGTFKYTKYVKKDIHLRQY